MENFLKSKEITYKQFGGEFVPWLSIIDILMFNDADTAKNFIKDFTLI